MNSKISSLKYLERALQPLIKSQRGNWTLAGLFLWGKAYQDLASFLRSQNLTRYVASRDLSKKSLHFQKLARRHFNNCIQLAQKNAIFSSHILACQKPSRNLDFFKPLTQNSKPREYIPRHIRNLQKKLLIQPKNINLLKKLAIAYWKMKDLVMTDLIFRKLLEIEPKKPEILARLGVVKMYKKEFQEAKMAFEKSAQEPHSIHGLAALNKGFGLKDKKTQAKAESTPKPKDFTHPWMFSELSL